MELRLPYDVVYCTSSEAAHPVTALSPTTTNASTGWQSAPGGKIPQILVLRFAGNVELTQLRILSHESKIASRVEVRLFAIALDGMLIDPPSFHAVRFAKLGTVEFSNNEHSHYRSKERKTVHLSATAYFVKLLFGSPHHNPHNQAGQIGVYSIECTGRLLSVVDRHADAVLHSFPIRSNGADNGSAYVSVSGVNSPSAALAKAGRESPFSRDASLSAKSTRSQTARGAPPPLTFSPARDNILTTRTPTPSTPTAGAGGLAMPGGDIPAFRSVRIVQFEDFLIRRTEELLALKDQAILVEDFETAKQCRDRISSMNQHSKRIYQLEQDKVQAIIDEDFDAAKEAKRTMDALIDRLHEDTQLPHPRTDFDSYECIGDTPTNLSEQRDRQEQSHSREQSPEIQVKSTPILVKQEDSQGNSNLHDDDKDYNDDVINGYAQMHGHDQGKNHSSGSNNNNNSDNENVDEDEDGSDKEKDESLPLVSKYAQRVSELVRDMGEQIDFLSPPNTVEYNVTIDENDTAIDLSCIPAWERHVASAIQSAGSGIDMSAPPASIHLSTNSTREALDLIAYTGAYTASCLFSRRAPLREAALDVLTNRTELFEASKPVQVEEAVLRFFDMNGCGLQDSVPNVVAAACGFVRMVLVDKHACLSSLLAPVVNLLPRLLYCAADHQPRVREEAITTLTLCVRTSSITNATILTAVLAEPVDRERRRAPVATSRAQLARLAVLDQLVGEARSGLRGAENNVWSKLLLPCINHQNGEVRDAAVNVLSHLVREKKLKLSKKRIGEIDNSAIREQLAGSLEVPSKQKGKSETPQNGGRVKCAGNGKRIAT